jgi:hypothetical protein
MFPASAASRDMAEDCRDRAHEASYRHDAQHFVQMKLQH